MKVRKFYAGTTREALRQVRDELGADAIILSNRQVEGGIEIMAVADMDVASLTTGSATASSSVAAIKPASTGKKQTAEAPRSLQENQVELSGQVEEFTREMVREIKFLRSMMEGQLAGFAWGEMERREPSKLEMTRHMLAVGFSPTLARYLLKKMPSGYDFDKGMRWLKAALMHNLHVVKPGDDIIEQGGIYACIGPTGVGKTTTVAKLAARCALRHGAGSLALLTTDSYRIGAHEQLRIYGKILGVPVYAIKDDADLQLTLSDLRDKRLVLIDTVGMSQRDRRLADQIAMLSGAGRAIKRLLLLGANAQGTTLEDVVQAYQVAGVDGCILTKIDEAVNIGGALDIVVRNKLPLHYVTNGQRVPEDIHLASPNYLVDRALKSMLEASSFTPRGDEFPLAMAAASHSWLDKERDASGAYGG